MLSLGGLHTEIYSAHLFSARYFLASSFCDAYFRSVETIFFDIPEIDCLLGSASLAGQIVEIYGPSQCGKTFLALSACSQRDMSLWIDADNTFPDTYAQKQSLHDRIVVMSQFDGMVDAVETLMDSAPIDMVVVDPVHAIGARDKAMLYRLLSFYAPMLSIPIIIASSGVDQNRLSSLAAVRIEMAPVRYSKNMVTYLMRTVKNINAPAWQEASFSKEIA